MWYFRPLLVAGLIAVVLIVALILGLQVVRNESLTLTLDVEELANTLVIKGETSLPNRAFISYEIVPAEAKTFEIEGVYASGIAFVMNGKYSTTIDTRLIPAGEAKVWVRFLTTPEQPQTVISKWGQHGQWLRGPLLMKDSKSQWLEVSKTLIIHK